jgi:hypothetical protein
MTGTTQISSVKALQLFTEHPRFKYRQCAPDVDDQGRAAGNTALSCNAWIMEDRDGVEPRKEREAREAATIDVCVSCPVMVWCDAYANSVRADGRLAEPAGIWGGRTARDRLARFKARPRREVVKAAVVAAPVGQVRTPQKLAVLLALAMSWDVQQVADAAGMDVRTANWQRSRLVTLLGFCRESTSRMQMLGAAVGLGLVDASVVVADDGSVLAVPPPAPDHKAAVGDVPAGQSPSLTLSGPVQLPLWQPEPPVADVHPLPSRKPLEAAA